MKRDEEKEMLLGELMGIVYIADKSMRESIDKSLKNILKRAYNRGKVDMLESYLEKEMLGE